MNIRIPSKLIFALGAVIVIMIALAAYRVTNVARPRSTVAATKERSSIAAIGLSLHLSLPSMYHFLHTVTPSIQTTVGYQPTGRDFQIALPVTSSSVAFSDMTATNEQNTYNDLTRAATYMNGYLIRQGFVSIAPQDQTNDLLSAVYFFKRSDAICQISIYSDLFLTCTSIVDLTSTATQAQPLVAAYETAAPNSGTTIITAPDIRASKTAGYTIATLPIYNNHGETSANFYKMGSGGWQIVNLNWYNDPHEDADIMPNCEDFESYTAVREAFTGQACYDSATRSMRAIEE